MRNPTDADVEPFLIFGSPLVEQAEIDEFIACMPRSASTHSHGWSATGSAASKSGTAPWKRSSIVGLSQVACNDDGERT